MSKIGVFDYFPVEFDKAGKIFKAEEAAALKAALTSSVTDLYVASHGWNNNKDDATALYEALFGHVSEQYATAHPSNRTFVVAGILWPSVRFDDADLIPGGGEGGGGGGAVGLGANDASAAALKAKLAKLHDKWDKPEAVPLSELQKLADKVERGPTAQKAFVDAIRECLPSPTADPADLRSDRLMKMPGDELFKAMSAPVKDRGAAPGGGGRALGLNDDAGRAAGIGDVLGGARAAAMRLLNLSTFYQMKERAGLVGRGVNALLGEIRNAHPQLKIHLVGHSFGARLVTSAANGPSEFKPYSMTLLQGAFSHNGFAAASGDVGDGFFRQVVVKKRIGGPIVATHTVNDKAVGIAYALASRLAGDNTKGIGDETDVYGGIGRNGAVRMSDAERVTATMLAPDGAYAFAKGKITNLLADQYIKSHGDVSNAATGNVVWQATVA